MKVTIDIDCTPQEARTFLGLPDLTPLHAIYLERMTQFVREGVTAGDVEKLLNQWMPMMQGGVEQWQKLMWDAAMGAKKS